MSRLVWLIASLGLLVACNVEPRKPFVEPDPYDAGPARDAGPRDAGGSCLFGTRPCPATEYCTANDTCVPIPVGCAATSDCRPGDVCVRPLVGLSTTTPGLCGVRPGACDGDDDCAGGHCLASGICGPRADRFVVSDGRPQLIATCADSRECGPRSVCTAGECGPCQDDVECPDRLQCMGGACIERASCLNDLGCYEGHSCGDTAVCVRTTNGCTPDPSNDFASGATVLTDAIYEGLTICGDDIDWYQLPINHLQGTFVTIAAVESYATLTVEVVAGGALVDSPRRIDLPGVVAFAIPQPILSGPGDTVDLAFSVSTLDRNATYRIEIARDRGGCGDELDLYGDSEGALSVPVNESFELVGCPDEIDRTRITTIASDRVNVAASWVSSSMDVDFAVFDDAGQPITTTPNTTNTSTESVTTDALSRDGLVTVEATPKFAATQGQPYTMTISRDLGSRQTACLSPTDLVLMNGAASVIGSFTGGANLGRPTCPAVSGCSGSDCASYAVYDRRDVLYRVRPPVAPAVLVATVSPRTTAPVRMSVALLTDCADDGSDVVCNSAALPRGTTTIERQLESTSDVFLMVSSDGTLEDFDFDLDLLVDPIGMPKNDTCFEAVDLSTTGSRVVSTYGAANDDQLLSSVMCGRAGAGAGGDRFYRMTLAANERAALELTGPRGGFLWAGLSCTQMTSTCTTAETISESFDNPVATARFRPGRDQTFYIAVDGLNQNVDGFFELRTIREPELQCLVDTDCTSPLRCDDFACRPVPANDTCPGTSITLDAAGYARVVGSTGAANDSQAVSCGAAGAPDVVYAVTIDPGFANVAFRVSEAKFDPVLAVRPTSCAADPNELCNDDARYPDVLLPEVRIDAPAAGVYYVIVDAFAGEGTFTLEIEATP